MLIGGRGTRRSTPPDPEPGGVPLQQCIRTSASMTPRRATIAGLIAAPVLIMSGLHSFAAHLDQATRQQCQMQTWPPSQHAAHLEFCRLYLSRP